MGNPLQPPELIEYKPGKNAYSKDIIRDFPLAFISVGLYFLISKIWNSESSFSWAVLIGLWIVLFFKSLNRRKVKTIWIDEELKQFIFLYKPFLNKPKSLRYNLDQINIEVENRTTLLKKSEETILNFIVDDINVIDVYTEKDGFSNETIAEIIKTAQQLSVLVTFKR